MRPEAAGAVAVREQQRGQRGGARMTSGALFACMGLTSSACML